MRVMLYELDIDGDYIQVTELSTDYIPRQNEELVFRQHTYVVTTVRHVFASGYIDEIRLMTKRVK